jgi:hypothetical protein
METRTVKFNLRHFVEDYIVAVAAEDSLEQESLEKGFMENYNSSSAKIKQGIENYIRKVSNEMQSPELQGFVNTF